MMKKLRIVTSFVLMLIIVFSFSGISFASTEKITTEELSNNLRIQTESVPEFVDKYVRDHAEELIYISELHGEEIDTTTLTIGSGFNIYSTENNGVIPSDAYYYPVLYQDRIVSTIAVATENGKIIGTTSGDSFCDELNKLDYTNTYKVIDVHGSIYAFNNGEWLFLKAVDCSNEDIDLNSISFSKSTNETTVNIKSSHVSVMRDIIPQATIQVRLNVPMVTQGTDPWCGAACCAMIINYHTGSNHTARSVTIDVLGSAVQQGITNSQARAWMQSKGYASSYTASTRTYDQVKTDIDASRPIYAVGMRTEGTDKIYHAMVLRGYRHVTENGNKYFHFRNPQNMDHMVSANSSTVTIVAGSRTYTWVQTIYNI